MKGNGKKNFFTVFLAALMCLIALPQSLFFNAKAQTTEIVPEGASLGGVLYEKNFSDTEDLDWTTEGVKIGLPWYADNGTAEFNAEQNGVRMQALSGTKAVALPVWREQDYVYSATIKVFGDGGSFGLLTDVENPATEAIGATYYGIYVNDATNYGIYHYTRTMETYENEVYANPMRQIGEAVSQGDICTLTVYNIVGTTYFYVNGRFALSSSSYMDSLSDGGLGLYVNNADVLVTSVKVQEVKGVSSALTIKDATVRYADEEGYVKGEKSLGLRFKATVDKNSELYQSAVANGTYDVSETDVKFGMLLLPSDLLPKDGVLTKDTPMVVDAKMEKISEQTEEELTFTVSLFGIPKESFGRAITARTYMKEKKGDSWEYTYAKSAKKCSFVNAGNTYYEEISDEKVRLRLDDIFEKTEGYYGKNAKRIKFSVFADFHYIENVYMSSVEDINTIIQKAYVNDADFVVHMGDFSNNYTGSPEIVNAYLNNIRNMPVYGIYGNHELQGASDTMAFVTPRLTNRAEEVTWGTSDGKIRDGSVGYYYFDVNGIRVICTDTNYSWNPTLQVWQHREKLKSNAGNTQDNAFGAAQRAWLRSVLNDAAHNDLSCIVLSHHAISGLRNQPPADAADIRAIFKEANEKRAGTVLMVMNGHLHTDQLVVLDDILYFDINTVRNGAWDDEYAGTTHYRDDLTFSKVSYDDEGNETGRADKTINSLNEGDTTWFYNDPLNTLVTVSSSGRIYIEGMQTSWLDGVVPPSKSEYKHCWISNGVFDMPVD